MKKILPFLLLFISIIGNAQTMTGPKWDQSSVSFETAKIQRVNKDVNKNGPINFKTSKIYLKDADYPNITIDIPDIYYIKDGEVYGMEYKKDEDRRTSIHYSIVTDDDYIGVTFYFRYLETQPHKILFFVSEEYKTKTPKTSSYVLTEFK